MSDAKPMIAYVVYSPPHKGLPYLAVTLMPDGSVVARQFDTSEAAKSYSAEMARGLKPDPRKH